jgi:hypothetical protein
MLLNSFPLQLDNLASHSSDFFRSCSLPFLARSFSLPASVYSF